MSEINRRTIGINFIDEDKAEVSVWAPLVDNLELVLTEKKIRIPLQKGEHGYWYTMTGDIMPGDRYKFVLNGSEQLPDPASLAQPNGVHEASAVVHLGHFNWSDEGWQTPALDKYIIYELHVGTFSEEETFAGVESKLDYLVALGITAIEIMPVAAFPGSRNWGYDGVYPFAVHTAYGGAAGLQKLVDACHAKGLAVILDVVYNHMGPEGNYFSKYAPYFTDKYQTPWGSAINFDDAHSDEVRRYFIENMLMWFRDFHIDALRLDAVHAIKDLSPKHLLREMRETVDSLAANTGRKYYLLAECDLNDTIYINPIQQNGYGMDAQWIDEFHHALRVSAGNDRIGYYADFDGVAHLAKAYKDAYVYDGQYSEHRQKHFGVKAAENPGKQFIVFSQNHDQVGNRMLGERTSGLVSFEMQKLLAGAVMISPYIPLLFMGEEWGETNPFLYFVSHGSPELIKAVREGRKAEFAAFRWQGEAPDPQDEATFMHSKLQWQLHTEKPHDVMLTYYRDLIALRKNNPVLSTPDRQNLEAVADVNNNTLTLTRWQDDEDVVCFLNFSGQELVMTLPANKEQWFLLFDSATYGGTPALHEEKFFGGNDITQPGESLLIFTTKHV